MPDNFDTIFNVMFTVVPILIFLGFAFTILMIVSPKFRGKMMSHQVKSLKHMMDNSQEDLKDITDNLEYVTHDSTRNRARAFSEGFGASQIYCKHCGARIDSDSRFCNKCGKEQ